MKLVLALVMAITAQFTLVSTSHAFDVQENAISTTSEKEAVEIVDFIFEKSDLNSDFSSDPAQLIKVKAAVVKLMLEDQEAFEAAVEIKNALPGILAIEDEEERKEQVGMIKMMILFLAAPYYEE